MRIFGVSTILIILIVMNACPIETGYRVDVKPIVADFNKIILSFKVFLKLDHTGREVEAEKELVLLYEKMAELKTKMKAVTLPEDSIIKRFHQTFSASIEHSRSVLDAYKSKFRVQISINNLEKEYNDLSEKLTISQTNYRTSQTASGKNTYRERIVSLTQEKETAKNNLDVTREKYLQTLRSLMSLEEYYFNQYPELVKYGKTAVLLSIFPPPKRLILQAERDKYFPSENITEAEAEN